MRSLTPNLHTFTLDRIRRILRAETSDDSEFRSKPTFRCDGTSYRRDRAGVDSAYSNSYRKLRAALWVRQYCSLVADPLNHISRLDDRFSELLECNLELKKPENEDEVIRRTCFMLSRLPETPPEFDGISQDIFDSLDERYFIRQTASPGHRTWNNLKIVAFVSTNVIRLALTIVTLDFHPESWIGDNIRDYVDTIAELMQSLCEQSPELKQTSEHFLISVFLWSAWQRSMMLFFSYLIGIQFYSGYFMERNGVLVLRPTPFSPIYSDVEFPGYLCRWAFELLRTDRGAVGADLRRFYDRYMSLYAGRLPRCCPSVMGSYTPCDGKAPENCGRFRGMRIQDQSAHVPSCSKKCTRLFWNESSFRNVTGARAVSLHENTDFQLKYVAASANTMAISHVWSHGQGGRPEKGTTGFNACLHNRYSLIARSIGCDSYWIDTPCIPGLHENLNLRKEAINKINDIFLNSKITLVCDRDLMDIDVSNLTLELQESILAALLVCDWNIRAWTLLEAIGGRRNIHFLFKDEKILSFNQIFETVYTEGSMDIVILFATAQHFFPCFSAPNKTFWHPQLHGGYLTVEEAVCLLNHRHATREGDGIVKWSLLCDEKASHSAEGFWRTRKIFGTDVFVLNTGFLMSRVPRIKECPGLTWVPDRPDLDQASTASKNGNMVQSAQSYTFEGTGSEKGRVTKDGFDAVWLQHSIDRHWSLRHEIKSLRTTNSRQIQRQIKTVVNMYLRKDRMGALLHPAPRYVTEGFPSFQYRGTANGTLLAVVGSNDDGLSWCWRGIYEWDNRVALPRFEKKQILLV